MNGQKNNKEKYRRSILLFLRFSGWIAGPVLIGALVGTWLDNRYNTEPWAFLIAIGASFILSMIGLIRESLKEYKKIEKEDSDSEKTKTESDS